MAAISWTTIEDAIQSAVAKTSGIPGDHCIWAYQGGKAPGYPYVSLDIDGVRGVGQAWKVRDDAPDAVDGAELRVRVRQHQTATLEIQVIGDQDTARSVDQILVDVLAGLDLYEYEIDEGGAGIGDVSAVQHASGTVLEPRAVATVQLHLASELEKRETYLRRWQLTVAPKNAAGQDMGTTTFWQPDVQAFDSGFSTGFEV